MALGLRAYTDYDFSRAVLKAFVERLEYCKIVIPFPETLTEILNSNFLRVRGDYDKILTFIKLYAFLNKKRLKKWSRSEVYIVTPEVCIEALKIIRKPLASMMSNLEERTRSLIECLKELDLDIKGCVIGKAEREKIAVKIGRSEKTVRRYLDEWETAGYMSGDGAKPKNQTLLYDIEEIEQKVAGLLDISKMAKDLTEKMEKEAREWLGSLSDNKPPGGTYPLNSDAAEKEALEHEKIHDHSGESLSNNEIADFQASFAGKAPKDWTKTECPNIHGNSNTKAAWFWRRVPPGEKCELCGQFAVEYEIADPSGNKLRRCEQCFRTMIAEFKHFSWKN